MTEEQVQQLMSAIIFAAFIKTESPTLHTHVEKLEARATHIAHNLQVKSNWVHVKEDNVDVT
jgi:hypothetical protein